PANVNQQQVGDHLVAAEAFRPVARQGDLADVDVLFGGGAVVDRLPQKHGGQHGQETQHGAQQEVAAVGHALDERGAKAVEILRGRGAPVRCLRQRAHFFAPLPAATSYSLTFSSLPTVASNLPSPLNATA